MGRNFQRFLYSSYAVALALIFCFLYFMKAALSEADQQLALLSYNHEVIIVLQDVLLSLQQAESNRRGYILTNNRDYIRDYNFSVKAVEQSLLYMKQLNAKGSYRDDFLDSLAASVNNRVELIKSSLDLAMGNNSSDSAQAVLTDKGKAMMGSIRGTILALMKGRQNARYDSQRALDQVSVEIDTLYEIAFVFVVMFVGALALATYFYFKKLGTIEKALRHDVFLARQQVQHATSRYQDLKVEMMEKMKSGESDPAKDT